MTRIVGGRRRARRAALGQRLIFQEPVLTGRQLVAILVAVVVAVVFYPVGAKAAGSLVTIVDPTTTSKALVATTGALKVGDGSGALTVDGTVASRLALPTNPWHYEAQSGPARVLLFAAPSGVTKLAITSLTYLNFGTFDTGGFIYLMSGANCSGTALEIAHRVRIPGADSFHATFPTPLVLTVTAPRSVCIDSNAQISVTAVGFYQ